MTIDMVRRCIGDIIVRVPTRIVDIVTFNVMISMHR